jgi:hypothetical protein
MVAAVMYMTDQRPRNRHPTSVDRRRASRPRRTARSPQAVDHPSGGGAKSVELEYLPWAEIVSLLVVSNQAAYTARTVGVGWDVHGWRGSCADGDEERRVGEPACWLDRVCAGCDEVTDDLDGQQRCTACAARPDEDDDGR